jgi:hypothetical protein
MNEWRSRKLTSLEIEIEASPVERQTQAVAELHFSSESNFVISAHSTSFSHIPQKYSGLFLQLHCFPHSSLVSPTSVQFIQLQITLFSQRSSLGPEGAYYIVVRRNKWKSRSVDGGKPSESPAKRDERKK